MQETKINVIASNDTIRSIVQQAPISENLKEQLTHVNVLVVPRSGYAGTSTEYFPLGTQDFVQFIRGKNTTLAIDVCSGDDDYKELLLHSDLLILADLVVEYFVAPLVVGFILDYVKTKLGSKQDKTILKSKIKITDEDNKRSAEIIYEGLAKDFDTVVGSTIRLMNSSSSIKIAQETADLEYEERLRRLQDNNSNNAS